MDTIWVEFLKAWEQEEDKENNVSKASFKVGDKIELPEDVAKALVTTKFCKETEKPDGDLGVSKALDSLQDKLTEVVEKTLGAAVSKVSDDLGEKTEKIFATVKDPDEEGLRGYKSAGQFFTDVRNAGANQGIAELLQKAPSGQNISNDSEGGFLIPETVSGQIWDNIMNDEASITPLTAQFDTNGNTMVVPKVFEASRKSGAGNRHGGILTYWLDEAAELTASDFKTGKTKMELHKLGALVYVTEEMLDDGGNTTVNFINRFVPDSIRFAVEEAYWHGTGVGKPKGLTNGDAMICVPLQSGQGNHTILHRNINKLYWRNINRSRANWYVHPDLAAELEFMYFDDDTTNKRPVYLPSNQVVNSPFGLLYGRPVIPTEHMKDFGSKGDIAFVDWSQYATLVKAGQGSGIKAATSIHVRFLFEETAFRFTFRVDGRELWTSPKEDLNGDTTRSPFTTLASRTGGGTSSGL